MSTAESEQHPYPSRNWEEVRAEMIARGQVSDEGIARARRQLEDFKHATELAELRKASGVKRQTDVAETLGVSQAAVSKLERGDLAHTQLGTLASYVEALGGALEVTAIVNDKRIELRD